MKQKGYTILMALMLTSTAIKYEGSNNNPFQRLSPSTLLFYTAICCHVLASTAQISLATTVFIFHVSGIVGCEALVWILVGDLWWYIINVLLLLVASFCFNYKDISQLIRGTHHVRNSEAQEAQEV